jgi:hypothetical protein
VHTVRAVICYFALSPAHWKIRLRLRNQAFSNVFSDARTRVNAGSKEEDHRHRIKAWFRAGAADGFNLMPDVLPSGLETFIDTVVPILQRRGLFRTEYSGSTLRDHFGLAKPPSRFAKAGEGASA